MLFFYLFPLIITSSVTGPLAKIEKDSTMPYCRYFTIEKPSLRTLSSISKPVTIKMCHKKNLNL